MRMKLIKVIRREKTSMRAAYSKLFCFKGDDGKSYQLWTDPSLGFNKRWEDLEQKFKSAAERQEEIYVDKVFLRGRFVDGDSQFSYSVVSAPKTEFTS